MNSKDIGDITELEVILAFTKLGFNVLQPYGDNSRYDLVVETHNGSFMRIQCKTAISHNNGASFHFDGRSSHYRKGKCINHRYTKNEIDFFATTFNGKVYIIPVEECKTGKTLRLLAPKNSNQYKNRQATNYEIDKITQTW